MHESTHAARQPQCLRPAPTRSKYTLDAPPSTQANPAYSFWTVSQAEPARNTTQRRRFPRSAKPTANNPRRKPHRSPGLMAKSTSISCETTQKSQRCDREQSRVNRQRRRVRAQPTRARTQHRSERTSVPRSPASGAENGFTAPPKAATMAIASAMPRRVTFIQLDASPDLQGKRSRPPSRKLASICTG